MPTTTSSQPAGTHWVTAHVASNPGQAQANITPVPTNQLTLHQLAKWGNTDQAPRLREWHNEGCLNIYRDRPRQPQFDLSPGMGQTTPPKYWTNLTEERRVDISITLLAEAAELGPACLAARRQNRSVLCAMRLRMLHQRYGDCTLTRSPSSPWSPSSH